MPIVAQTIDPVERVVWVSDHRLVFLGPVRERAPVEDDVLRQVVSSGANAAPGNSVAPRLIVNGVPAQVCAASGVRGSSTGGPPTSGTDLELTTTSSPTVARIHLSDRVHPQLRQCLEQQLTHPDCHLPSLRHGRPTHQPAMTEDRPGVETR